MKIGVVEGTKRPQPQLDQKKIYCATPLDRVTRRYPEGSPPGPWSTDVCNLILLGSVC